MISLPTITPLLLCLINCQNVTFIETKRENPFTKVPPIKWNRKNFNTQVITRSCPKVVYRRIKTFSSFRFGEIRQSVGNGSCGESERGGTKALFEHSLKWRIIPNRKRWKAVVLFSKIASSERDRKMLFCFLSWSSFEKGGQMWPVSVICKLFFVKTNSIQQQKQCVVRTELEVVVKGSKWNIHTVSINMLVITAASPLEPPPTIETTSLRGDRLVVKRGKTVSFMFLLTVVVGSWGSHVTLAGASLYLDFRCREEKGYAFLCSFLLRKRSFLLWNR